MRYWDFQKSNLLNIRNQHAVAVCHSAFDQAVTKCVHPTLKSLVSGVLRMQVDQIAAALRPCGEGREVNMLKFQELELQKNFCRIKCVLLRVGLIHGKFAACAFQRLGNIGEGFAMTGKYR